MNAVCIRNTCMIKLFDGPGFCSDKMNRETVSVSRSCMFNWLIYRKSKLSQPTDGLCCVASGDEGDFVLIRKDNGIEGWTKVQNLSAAVLPLDCARRSMPEALKALANWSMWKWRCLYEGFISSWVFKACLAKQCSRVRHSKVCQTRCSKFEKLAGVESCVQFGSAMPRVKKIS